MVILLPFAFETVAPTGTGPELGLFQINRLSPRIDRGEHALRQIAAIRKAGSNIRNLASAVEDKLAALFLLRLVPMFLTVKVSAQVRSVPSPRHPRHDGHSVAMLTPGANAIRGRVVDAIHHDRIGINIGAW